MNIPTLNPLRFFEQNGTKLKDYLSFAEASEYWNSLSGGYTQKFQDRMQSIVYEDAISGAYGFSSTEEFNVSGAVNPSITACKLCVDSGVVIYTNLDGATTGKKLVIKLTGSATIDIRENTTIIETLTSESGMMIYDLTQNYTNLTVRFTSTSSLCITSIQLCEPSVSYLICNEEKNAELIDTCSRGGVYLMTSSTIAQIENTGSVWTKKIWRYVLDTSTITNYTLVGGDVIINFNNGYVLTYPTAVDFITDLENAYDWVGNFEVSGDIVTLLTPYRIDSVESFNPSLGNFTNVIIDSETRYLTQNFYFIANGTESFTGEIELVFETNTGDLIINLDDVDFTKTNDVSYAIVRGNEVYNYDNCCQVLVGNYQSEYFSVISEADKHSLKLLEVGYSSVFMDKSMAFSEYWDAKFLINATLNKSDGSDIEVFIGQQTNLVTRNFAKKLKNFVTGAIPDYLCDLLGVVWGLDNVTIEGVPFVAEDSPEESEFESRTDLFQFEIKLRDADYDFVI